MNKDIQYIIAQGENGTAEFKTSFSDEAIISLGAFSNAKGGTVYIGVLDNGEVKGVSLGKETVAHWINEIVLNMIVHRDYRSNSDAVVKIFDDKIEFYNPGKLPEGITVEDLLKNNYKSTPRNKAIAEFFKNLGLIEKYGSGIGRIVNYFAEENLPEPEFKTMGEGFQVTVFASFSDKKPPITENEDINVGANVGVNKLLNIIEDNPGINAKKIYQFFDVTDRTIERWLKKLRDEGKIEFRGAAKTGGYWRIKE